MSFISNRALQNVDGRLGSNFVHITRKYSLSFKHVLSNCLSLKTKLFDRKNKYIQESECIVELTKCFEGVYTLDILLKQKSKD